MEEANKYTLKGCGTRCLEQQDHQTVISEHYSRHISSSQKAPPLALSEGQLISYHVNNGFTLQGGKTHELIDFEVLSTVQKSLVIVVLLEGKLEFGYDSLNFELDADTSCNAVLVNLSKPASFHRQLYADNHVTKLNISLPIEWVESRCDREESFYAFLTQHLAYFKLRLNEQVLSLSKDLIRLSSPTNFMQRMQVESLTLTLFMTIFEQLKNINIQNTIQAGSNLSNIDNHFDQRLDALMVYIESHINDSISIQTLSEVSAMSASSLQRKFKATLGCSVNSYIRRRRLEIAKQQLGRGAVSITEVAYNAGYRHPSNFTNAFKKQFGYSPTESVKNS
ncbi:AraC family transcriptional regulator [Psychromonas sp. 14N.309.X.WAT.B.A12]|uniref:AraC family transcriptional regulator n=1 Tax=unclassified Psychromonas TaxID=2614957 RepID=UPI0025B16D8F|nr:AraC family transcriptional regulator [Psychromonas sp. 14N.309.X.WAT.B.A12]MDN2663529.1 AraC family transcriptional regulator [Psychromonas sp. 14N.309.X.WAT.B.A12]